MPSKLEYGNMFVTLESVGNSMSDNKFIRFITSKWLISLILLISGVWVGYFVYTLGIVPERYLLIAAGIFVLVVLIFFLIENSADKANKEGRKVKRGIITKIISMLLSLSLVGMSFYAIRTNQFVNKVTNSKAQLQVISIIVLKSSDITKISELADSTVGTSYQSEKKYLAKGVAALENDVSSIKEEKYNTYTELADALYKKEVTAIAVGEEFRSMLEANHENFDTETKVIKQYSFKKTNTVSTTVDTDVTSKPFSVYITGIDTYGSVSTVSRTDVNLILTINPTTHTILMVSLPRDTEIKLHRNGQMDKLTHTGIYGTSETINTIEDFLDTEINYYARTNFSGITNIIDALGGVTVKSDYSFKTRHGNYTITKGENEMDGDKALCFVRERYALPNGDFDRGVNQQRLLKAILKKAMSAKILTNYNQILTALEGSFETDMSSKNIKSLVKKQLSEQAEWKFYSVQLQGEGYLTTKTYSMRGTSIYVMKPYTSQLKTIKKLIDKVEAGEKITSAEIKSISTDTTE